MKNIMMYLFIVFSLFVVNTALADECETAGKVKLSQLKYVGTDLKPLLRRNGACTVVKASNDTEGRAACGTKRAALNPGNPQYTGVNDHGSQTNNKLGYYFCVGMNKRAMCNDRISELGSTMDIVWKQTGSNERNDGDCLCGKKGDGSTKMMACPVTEAQVDAFKDGKTTGCVQGAEDDGDGNCRCLAGEKKGTVVKDGGTCPKDPSPPVATATVSPDDFDDCLAEVKAAKDGCSEEGKKAIASCSKEAPEVNKNISEAQRVLSIGLDAVIAKNAGTGALASCAKMGAAGTSVIEALSLLRENCKKELNNCKKSCEQAGVFGKKTEDEYVAECKAVFLSKQKEWTDEHEKAFKPLVAEYTKLADNSEKFCKGDVQKSDNQLDGFLQELAMSVQKADICKCQLTTSSAGNENCDNVAGPLTCIQNVNQPGCSFSSVGCSPGSTLPGCRNPVNMTNPNGSGIAMPASGFAGPGFTSTGGGSGNSSKVGLGGDDFDFSDETRPSGSGTATADAGSPFGTAAGGGSGGAAGGGGGGGGGTGDGGGAGGEEKEKGGISGFFQNAKGGIASLFGAGADNKNVAAKKPVNKAYKNDVNGFRPKAGVRGMAGSNEFGSKNRDIWKTMNERYNDQYHTFITVENPQK